MEKLITLFLFGISFSETTEFMVSFLGLDAAKVEITEKDTIFNGYEAKSITFKTETVSASKTFFPVDNTYHTIIKNDFSRILYFQKSTSQPWLKNNLKTSVVDNKIFYENSSIEIPTNYLNIFSLLELVNHITITELLDKQFYLDREGRRYTALFKKGENLDELLLDLNVLDEDVNSVIEETDIFTWAVFREGAKRILRIKNGKLVYCEFSLGFVTMKAEIVEK